MSIHPATYDDIVEQCQRLARQGRRLRPDQPQIAAFDADGTLWEHDVADLLWDHLLREKAIHRLGGGPLAGTLRACGLEPAHDPYADFPRLRDLSRRGACSEETMVRVMLQGLAGLREDEVYVHSQKAVAAAEGTPAASRPAFRMIEQLRDLGFRVIVVSGSPRWTVEVAVRSMGIEPEDIIAGQVAVVEGVLTHGVIEPLPHGKGKIQAILRRFGAVPHVSVGNGLGDLAMLEAASHLKLLINPTEALLRACEEGAAATTPMGLLHLPEAAATRTTTLKPATARMGSASDGASPARRPRARR